MAECERRQAAHWEAGRALSAGNRRLPPAMSRRDRRSFDRASRESRWVLRGMIVMIGLQRIELAGQRFVVIPEGEFERLCSRAGETVPLGDDDLPALPKPDKNGRYPAI